MIKKKADGRVFPIVGIGASAGGLQAITQLLTSLPPDTGMAFVVVQHLDPSRESLLTMILQKATAMTVEEATDGIRIEPNRVYVIPPNTHMVVSGGRLRLMPRPEGVHAMSVNCFLNSLAEERGNKAIAVILSGTASDGALGVKAIKAEGGFVFAQDEQSAGHFGMPQSAAATGTVDFVLPPDRIAAEIVRIAQHPVLDPDAVVFDDAKSLSQIFLLLRRATGVDFGLYKPSTVKRRLLRRLMLNKFDDLGRYVELLEKNPDEVRALHDDLLIHVTHFFREPASYAALRAKAFPRILKGLAPDAPIRVWVPGCSTGEEAYSIAIELLDYLSERDAMNPVQIFATDISEVSLERARMGSYSEEIQNHVPARLLRRYFTKVDRGYAVVKRVRDSCIFARQDLTKDPPFASVDLISCCNVLIYLGPPIQKQVLPMFHYALKANGALLLGRSESVGEFSTLFTAADKKTPLYFKNPATVNMRLPARPRPADAPAAHEAPSKPKAAAPGVWPETDVQKVAERILLERFAPAGVVVNRDLTVLHFRGRVSRFLEPVPGKANLNLLKMLPAHAADAVKALLQKAKKQDSPVKGAGIELGDDDGGRAKTISVEAVPFRLPISGERYFIVLFEEDAARARGAAPAESPRAAKASRAEADTVRRLKTELASTRGYLQTIVEEHEGANEELKSANEEIVSSNEELQSTNEELEIAKEELQAANEELSTVNEELQTRNNDLGQLNDDLGNLLSSVHLPILMVSSDLRIRRFTPTAERIMNLIPGDVGRPIGDIKPKFELPNIEDIIHEVIETVTIKELEIRDKAGHAFTLRVRPYKTTENKIEGAVIIFIENDPITRSVPGVAAVSAFEAVLEMSNEPLAILDSQMRLKGGSKSLYQSFGLTESSLGRSLFEVEKGRWNVPALRAQLERVADTGMPFSKLDASIEGRKLSFSGRRIGAAAGGPPLILLSINPRL